MPNRAIWLGEDEQVSIRDIEDSYTPLESEVLVEVLYSGINPADIKHGGLGFNNCVAGYDFAGKVIRAGRKRTDHFSPGDLVLGFSAPALNKPQQYGVHQKYHCAQHFIYHVPPTMPLPAASCLPVVTHTAADALFNQLALRFRENSCPVLIWGASSAVGTAAVQFAKMAGCYPILATASEKNHQALRELGATECFDYRDPNIVDNIKEALKRHSNKPLQHVLDAVVSHSQPSSTELCEAIADPGARFTSPMPVADQATKEWRPAFACRNVDVTLSLPGGVDLTYRAAPEWQANIDHATKWAIDHYDRGYVMPHVQVVKGGEKGIEAMINVAAGRASMEKFVIEHPI